MFAHALLATILSCVQAQAQTTQLPPATFRAATHLRVQTVSVKDKQGRPIQGLTAKDFVVTEDGVAQQIAFVEYQPLDDAPAAHVPAAAADALGVPPVTNIDVPVPSDGRYRGRRLIVLYFDLFNMPFFDQQRMYAGADTYIDRSMAPADVVAIVAFENGKVTTKQTFTDDRPALREVIRQMLQAADDQLSGGIIRIDTGGQFGEDDDTFNLFSTDRQLAALQTAVTDLGPLPEIKTLVYFGSGLRLNGADNQAQLRATVNAAVRSNVTINPIDTRGLSAEPLLGDATRASPGGIGMFNGSLAQNAVTKQQQSQDTYYALAKDTGGRAMFDYNDLSAGVVQAAQAVTGYYMLGYYASNDAKDGRLRRLRIALTSNLSAELSYRPGYYAPKEYAKFNATDKERQLEDALRAEDPITEIPMAVDVNYFRLNAAEYFVPVSVRMPGSDLVRPRPDGSARGEIDMIGEIKDNYGVTVRNAKDKLQFTLDPGRAAQVLHRQIQFETGFTVLPGSYAIKLLARDDATGHIGTVLKSFTIPNLDREQVRLPISSVVLTSERVPTREALFNVKQKIDPDAANPLVFDGRKLIPNVSHTFSARQPLYVFLQSYEQQTTAMRPLVAYASFYRGNTKQLESPVLGFATGWNPTSGAVPIRFTASLAGLEPGEYDCQITVLDPGTGRAAFWRAAVVIVR
jgi:VWFA-related protein